MITERAQFFEELQAAANAAGIRYTFGEDDDRTRRGAWLAYREVSFYTDDGEFVARVDMTKIHADTIGDLVDRTIEYSR